MADLRSSRAMVERASQGDADAVGELLDRHISGLFAFVRLNTGALLGAKESHADLVQSTCRELLEHMRDFQYHSEAEFRSWLYTAALNKIRNKVRHYRTEKRDFAREVREMSGDGLRIADLAAAYGGTPSDDAIAREGVRRLEAVFTQLSDDQRRVVTLVRICGLSHAQVAEELGIAEAAARKIYSRASARIILALRD